MFGIKANVRAPHKYLRMGAKVIVTWPNYGNGCDKMRVWGMSRGGRMVETFVDARDLGNYRAGWLDEKKIGGHHCHLFSERDGAVAEAAWIQDKFGSQPVRPHAEAFGNG